MTTRPFLFLVLAASTATAQPVTNPETGQPPPTPTPTPTPTPPPTPTPTPPPPPDPIVVPDEPITSGKRPPAAATPTTTPGEPTAPTPTTLDEIAISTSRPRLELNVFGVTSAALSSEGNHFDYALGPLGFLITGHMSPSLTALAEFVMENAASGELVVDLERVILKWTHGPFTFGAGRIHSELGYWNTAFHHGTWLQPTIERPRTVRFEDDEGLLPVHVIGPFAEYRRPLANGRLRAHLAISNGRGAIVDDVRVASDLSAYKAVTLNLALEDVVARGSKFGVAVYANRIPPQPATARALYPDKAIAEVITNLFGVLRNDKWTAIGEAYWIAHKADRTYSTFEAFGLLGYTIDRYTPYLLLEGRTRNAGTDPFFVPDAMGKPLSKFVAANAGVRIELSTWCATKIEGNLVRSGDTTEYQLVADWAFGL